MSNLTDPESLFALLRRRDDGRLDERLGRGRVQECSAVEEWQIYARMESGCGSTCRATTSAG